MSSNFNQAVKDLVQIITEPNKNKTTPYDTQAEVRRIEDNIAWVHIPGGVEETPVRLTMNAKAGDIVQVRVSGGSAWLMGNATSPPTDDTRAEKADANAVKAYAYAEQASGLAEQAEGSAEQARQAAEEANLILDEMQDAAEAAGTTLTQIYADATIAKESAANASEYAARALGNLSTVQNVTETLNWITAHGTMTLTDDQALDPTHVYFVVDANGDYEVAGTHYSVVTEPSIDDISTYYELSIDESLNNYVGTHLAVTSEGLWLLPDAGGNKVLIATGQGSTYTSAGTYIIGKENGSDVVLAAFLASRAQIGKSNGAHIEMDFNSMQLKDLDGTAYFVAEDARDADGYVTITHNFTMGGGAVAGVVVDYPVSSVVSVTYNGDAVDYSFEPDTTSVVPLDSQGNPIIFTQGDKVVIVYKTVGDLFKSFTFGNRSSDDYGKLTFAEGKDVQASGDFSHAQNLGTVALAKAQTVLGTYNKTDPMSYPEHPSGDVSYSWYALIIGNGTDNNRSNAFEFTWGGNMRMYLDSTNDYDLIYAINALGWTNEVIV